MKKIYILLNAIALLLCVKANAAILSVNPDGSASYTSITAAISAASSGDTLNVFGTITGEGVSGEGIVVNKNLTITGQGAESTIIEAASTQNTANRRVFTIYAGRTVTIKNLTIRHGKTASSGYPAQWGGGILNYGILTVDNCVLRNNNANSSGGAIYNDKYNQVGANGVLTVTNSTIMNNVGGDYGSGICNGYFGTVMTLTNCTVFGNTGSSGIGLDRSQSSYITNCTVSGNTSGIWTYAGGNTLYLKNSIVAANTGNDFTLLSGASVVESYNIVLTSSGYSFTGTGTLTGVQPYLELSNTLEPNNSFNPTQTLALYTSSIAIDAGSSAAPNGIVAIPCKDQRGYMSNGTKDIGAYEFDGATNVPSGIVIASHPSSQSTCLGSSVTFSVDANTNYRQWRKDGVVIPGETGVDLVVSNVDFSSLGDYDCLLFETCAVTSTNPATLSMFTDITAPVADNITLPTIYGTCTSPAVASAPTATDDCIGTVTGTTSNATSYSNVGNYTINWSYEDNNGNISTQSQQVIVIDTVAPVPQLSSLPQVNGTCSVTLTPPQAVDACEGVVTATTTDPLSYSSAGNYQVTWTYDDGYGNTTEQVQDVVIADNLAPVPDVSSLAPVNGVCDVQLTAPTATDNCSGSITATTTDPTYYSSQGSYSVTWSYDDGNGNVEYQVQNVNISDNIDPVPSLSSLPDLNESCGYVASSPEAMDNCSGQIFATSADATSFPSPGTYTITWEYSDGNGNTVTQSQNVNISDNLQPVPDITNLPEVVSMCSATLTAPTATDNCAGKIIATTTNPTIYTSPGNYTVTWEYSDGNGNTSSQNQTVIVQPIDTAVSSSGNALQATLGATNYQWLNCGDNYSEITGETSSSFSPIQSGYYAVRISNGNCIDTSSCHYLVVIQTGIESSNASDQIEIFPNPSKGAFRINMKSGESIRSFALINHMGATILDSEHSGQENYQVDLSDYSPGIYYVRVYTDKNVIVKRIIVNN